MPDAAALKERDMLLACLATLGFPAPEPHAERQSATHKKPAERHRSSKHHKKDKRPNRYSKKGQGSPAKLGADKKAFAQWKFYVCMRFLFEGAVN
ncbi:hypothetical protein KEM56_006018, partial [Ascosphaera pollenicola]